ncbi:hypothetical protein [Dysgonomonas sp. ZJ279]|uniref:hypothetical protein n=1 Tax=Dysgonomonas sp. ZJ279 TaxID=2709796 RepID=UPI0013EA023B|nr:hypothetical protein [Dysgonomonas sp. ZJ279]
MNNKQETFNRARLEILNYVMTFCTNTLYDGKCLPPFGKTCGFESGAFADNPPIGSLVRLMAAPFTKWYLSWLLEIKEETLGYRKYLLKSVEDGSLCWWENIGLYHMPLEESDKFPHWKYNDNQFEFWDKWKKANKWEDVYVLAPLRPIFNGLSVTLDLRKKHTNDIAGSKTFCNWNKLTIREMREFIRETAKSLKRI